MWLLISRRLRRALLLMIAMPLLGRVLHLGGRRLESSRGPSRLSSTMQRGGSTLNQYSRGPLRPRGPDGRRSQR